MLAKTTILKITPLEKARFIKVNELKLTHVELFYIFHILRVASNASEFYVWPIEHLFNAFYSILTILFKYKILYGYKLASFS